MAPAELSQRGQHEGPLMRPGVRQLHWPKGSREPGEIDQIKVKGAGVPARAPLPAEGPLDRAGQLKHSLRAPAAGVDFNRCIMKVILNGWGPGGGAPDRRRPPKLKPSLAKGAERGFEQSRTLHPCVRQVRS